MRNLIPGNTSIELEMTVFCDILGAKELFFKDEIGDVGL